jgi:hypothetical protein
MAPLTAYNKSGMEVRAIMAPFLRALDELNMTYHTTFSQWSSYYDHYNQYFGPLPLGSIRLGVAQESGRVGGRLLPRSTVQGNSTALGRTARFVAEQGVTWVGVALNVSRFGGHEQNAVLPAWRDTLVHVILTAPVSPGARPALFADDGGDFMTQKILPAMEAISPGSGAYMNEADFRQPNFQREFFGSNYARLLDIKRKYDPDGFFYAVKGVGSEAWDVSYDGRMCRTTASDVQSRLLTDEGRGMMTMI